MSKPTSPLSIVICAFNGLEYTKLLIESIRKHSRYEHEVVLYSDGSSDGTLDWLRGQGDIKWRHDRVNRGICTAMNRAAREASRRYLFFPNTDHVVAPGWDEAMLKRLKSRTVVSCQCVEPGIVPVASIFHSRNCGGRWDEFDESKFHAAAAELMVERSVPGINYPFAISRELWAEAGGLDESFNPGPANDPDLFYRLTLLGAEMVRADDCLVYHFSGKSSRLAGEALSEHPSWHEVTERNEARFAEKWGERYRYSNGGLPDPGPEARHRWEKLHPKSSSSVAVRSRLKVAIDANSIDDRAQGIGICTLNLIRALADLRENVEIHLVSQRPGVLRTQMAEIGGISIHDSGKRPKDLGVSVFHGPAFDVSAGVGLPSVVTIHDVAFSLFPKWYPRKFTLHMKEIVKRALESSAHVIAISDRTKADLVDRFKVDPNRVTRIHEAPPPDAISPSSAKEIEYARSGIAGGTRFILAVGMQQRRKNAVGLVRAFGRLRTQDASALPALLLVGASECEDPRLEGEIKRLRKDRTIFRTGHIPRRELVALYRAAELFIYPSFYEGFGIPPLEAMAAGTPVVASNRASIPEVLGDAALLVSPDDPKEMAEAMASLLQDGALRSSIVERGKKQAALYSWEETARRTLEVYRKVAQSKPIEVRTTTPSKRSKSAIHLEFKPRIAVDARLLGQDRLGTGRYTSEVLRGLAGHIKDAEFVYIGPDSIDSARFPSTDSIMQLVPAGLDTLLNPAWEQYSLPSHLLGCDLYFAPTGIAPVTAPCPTVPVIHDLGFEDHPAYYEDGLKAYLSRWVKNSCQAAGRIIAVSEFTRDKIVSQYGISSDRIDVIHHGRSKTFGAHKPDRESPWILCVSSFEPNKNLPILVEAFHRVSEDWKGCLILAGRSGRDLVVVQELIRKHGLQGRVRVIADPDDHELARLYQGATLFAFPSLYEGFGLPVLEAMTVGLPVVTGTAAACLEIVGEAGISVAENTADSWASTLIRVLADPKLLEELGKRSLARAELYSWEDCVKKTWETLASCLEVK